MFQEHTNLLRGSAGTVNLERFFYAQKFMRNYHYGEKLKDPRWQRRRLEILNRDNFTCQKCLNTKDTLHIHHRHYIVGRDPWDYPNELLVTLCFKCHEEEEKFADKAQEILESMHFWGFFNTEIIGVMNKMVIERIEKLKQEGKIVPVPDNEHLPF